ncbi:MAG: cation diffusion facilitator family transporter [Candidatus Omnitrophica bacterium]|jgi:cation diffusion facilitator family transporter|nr:cation diffusion facilitator family transporter [Candidatus Omnitrophota bacterium]
MNGCDTPDTHYRRIQTILIWILALNWLVALAKIIYGLFSRFSSMTADGFHSLADGTSNIICLIGIHFASQPTDKDHPYGHKKYETLFSLVIAGLLFFVCFNLFKEGVAKLRHPAYPDINPVSFCVMLVTLGVNLWVMRYEYKKGRELKSDLLISDSLHTKADIFISLSVIAALVVMALKGPAIIDPVITIMISLFIAHVGFKIARESASILCDTAVIMDDRKISDVVLKIKGVKTCHNIRTRGRLDDIHVDMHVQVNPHMHIDDAHKISDTIEEVLKKAIPGVTDVVVHMEPLEKH